MPIQCFWRMLTLIVVLTAFVIVAISATVNRKRDVRRDLGEGREPTMEYRSRRGMPAVAPTATAPTRAGATVAAGVATRLRYPAHHKVNPSSQEVLCRNERQSCWSSSL
jgi:hypothetical protein